MRPSLTCTASLARALARGSWSWPWTPTRGKSVAAATLRRPPRGLDLPARDAGNKGHAVELPVTFAGGAGLTRTVSLEAVRFATASVLGVGQRIGGALHFPPDPAGTAPVLRYAAWVTEVGPSTAGDGALKVRASFERLEFVAGAANRPCATRVGAFGTRLTLSRKPVREA